MNAHEAMLRDHVFTVTVDRWGASLTVECKAKEGAGCRLDCPEECEEFEVGNHEHELIDAGRCLIGDWIDNDDTNALAEEVVLYRGPATNLEWSDGWRVWLKPVDQVTNDMVDRALPVICGDLFGDPDFTEDAYREAQQVVRQALAAALAMPSEEEA